MVDLTFNKIIISRILEQKAIYNIFINFGWPSNMKWAILYQCYQISYDLKSNRNSVQSNTIILLEILRVNKQMVSGWPIWSRLHSVASTYLLIIELLRHVSLTNFIYLFYCILVLYNVEVNEKYAWNAISNLYYDT